MATNTKNYNLVKPAENELADINVLNKNMDVIDEQILPVNSLVSDDTKKALAAVQGKILNGKIGDLTTLTTEHKETLVQAINEAADGAGITVVTENQYKDMQKAGTVDANKLYGIVDSYDSSAGNVAISDTLSTKLGLSTEKNVEKAIDTVDNKASQNTKSIAGIESSLLKKDGSVQMTGVLKTKGGSNNTEQIALGNNTYLYSNSVNGVFLIASNARTADGTNWTRVVEGVASITFMSADGYIRTHKAESGLPNSAISWDNGQVTLTDKTGLPITGGTLSGGLNVGGVVNVNYLLKVLGTAGNASNNFSTFAKAHYDNEYGTDIIDCASDGKLRYLRIGGPYYTNEMGRLVCITSNADGSNMASRGVYHEGNITVSASAPSSALAEGCQHQVYA